MSRDTEVPRSGDMRARPGVDREVWAAEVRSLIATVAGGNLTEFARLVGTDRRNVTRWLGRTVDVSEDSVRQVARVVGVPAGDLLVKVGLFDAADLPGTPAPLPREDSASIEAIEASGAQPAVKRKLFAHLKDAREQHERQRFAEIQRMISILVGGRR